MRPTPTLALAACALTLSACFSIGGPRKIEEDWQRKDVSIEAMSSDLGDCKKQAYLQTRAQEGVDRDIAAARGSTSTSLGRSAPLPGSADADRYSLDKRRARIVDSCMRKRGYSPVE